MRCVLHIGTEKTGTTTIQRRLAKNDARLAKQGFHYCKSLGRPSNRHIATSAMRPNRSDDSHRKLGLMGSEERTRFISETRQTFAAEVHSLPSTIHTFIISSEHCHSRLVYQDEVARVHQLLAEYFEEIQIVVYLRPQIEVEISLFSTALRNSHHRDNVVRGEIKTSAPYFNYSNLLTGWESAFGKNNLIVRNIQDAPDVFADICSLLAIDTSDFDTVGRHNIKLSAEVAHFLNNINVHLPIFIDNLPNPLRADIVNALADRPFKREIMVSRKAAMKFQYKFDASNEDVRKRYFPKRARLFHIDFEQFPEKVAAHPTDQEEIFEIIAEIWKREKKRQFRQESKIAQLEGRLLRMSGDLDAALEKFRMALQKNPDNVEALRETAFFYAGRGMNTEAREYCDRALQLRPNAKRLIALQKQLTATASRKSAWFSFAKPKL